MNFHKFDIQNKKDLRSYHVEWGRKKKPTFDSLMKYAFTTLPYIL